MKAYMTRLLSMILVVAIFTTGSLAGLAESVSKSGTPGGATTGGVYALETEITWAEAARQIAGMLGFIVEDAANIDLTALSSRITDLSLTDDSVYLAILADQGYLPEEFAQIKPSASITGDEYIRLMEAAFPTVVDSQAAIDEMQGEPDPGNIALIGDGLTMDGLTPARLALTEMEHLSLSAIKAQSLSLNAAGSVDLTGCEIERVHIKDAVVKDEAEDEETAPDRIYLHMDSTTQLPEVIVKGAEAVLIEGSGALGLVRVQESVGSLTVRASTTVVNETEAALTVTGPDAQVVELQPGEQVDFVLTKWLVSFVTEGTPVETQEIAPGCAVDYGAATTTLEGKVFTAWYEDAEYTTPVSLLSGVDRQMTLYARFVDEADAAVVTFETFDGRALAPLTFAKGEYLLTKPVDGLYTSKEGYSFGGWCVDAECTTGFGYTDPIEESMTLYARFIPYEQQVIEEPGNVAEVELPDAAATIAIILPEGMTVEQAAGSFSVEAGAGNEPPEISVRETADGAELYCEAGFVPGSSFTLTAQDGVLFADQPEYVDTLTVSVFREQIEVVEFAEGLTYVLWDDVTDYTPVTQSEEYTGADAEAEAEVAQITNLLGDPEVKGDIIPGTLILSGEIELQPDEIVVFYDGEINRDEANVSEWKKGDLAGYVLYSQIVSVEKLDDGRSKVTFRYANLEDYISELDIHTTESVDLEEELTEKQIGRIKQSIANQVMNNEELQTQMLVAAMTSQQTQMFLDEEYGAGTYSLASMIPDLSKTVVNSDVIPDGDTVTITVELSFEVGMYGPTGKMATISPSINLEQVLTMGAEINAGKLWIDAGITYKSKTTISLQMNATTGDDESDLFAKAHKRLSEVITPNGEQIDDYDYLRAVIDLSFVMQELENYELEYQDWFAVRLFRYQKRVCYGLITFGVQVELVGQAAVISSFGVTISAEYGYKVGFHFNFKKFKGSTYKQTLNSDVTSEIYLIGKLGVRFGLALSLYCGLTVVYLAYITGTAYAYAEIAGMFMHKAAASAGGGNYAGGLYFEVGIDFDLDLTGIINLLLVSFEVGATLWSGRWPMYSLSRSMNMTYIHKDELEKAWAEATKDANYVTSYHLPYLPVTSFNMYTAGTVESQLLFETLQEGEVTAKLTLENIVINGEPAEPGDPRIDVMTLGDGTDGHRIGSVYANEYAAAAYKVEDYQCDVVLTYENRSGSELIKHYRQVFPLHREFKMAATTVNVRFALYDWCAHSWGIEAADWDNATLLETSFEDVHVLGCPTATSADGEVDLDALIAQAKQRYPEIAGATLSWFNPTLNSVRRLYQYSTPHTSALCYLLPDRGLVSYDVFETTKQYNLTFYLYANRYKGYSSDITYIIEADDAPEDTVFTVRADNGSDRLTFTRVAGTANRWSLTVPRATFDGTSRPIMMRVDGGESVTSGLTINGREEGPVVTLKLGQLAKKLTVNTGEGVESWEIQSHDPTKLDAIKPGEKVVLVAKLAEGYQSVRLSSEPEGLTYVADGDTITFTMPANDVAITLYGVHSYQASFLYNYDDLGVYQNIDVDEDVAVPTPADPTVDGLTFAGWYDNAACTGTPFDFTQLLTGDVVLYADWRVNVTVDLGGPKGPAEANDYGLIFPGDEGEYARYTYTTHKLGETALDYKLPSYAGYVFTGWYLNPDFTGESVDPAQHVLTGGVTFYACWREVAMLTYELNYGVQDVPYDIYLEHVGAPLQHIPEDPQREHYKFLGWFRTPSASTESYVRLDEFIPEYSTTLYAGWKPLTYTISYELNGGENAPSNPAAYTVESDAITIAEPTRRGYRFLGWTAKGVDAVDGAVRIPAGHAGDVALTANWEVITYTLSADAGKGAMAEAVPATYTVDSDAIALSNPTRSGYTFLGWTGTELTEPTADLVIPAGSIGDRSYKAVWRANTAADDILAAALAAIPDAHTMNANDFTGIDVIYDLAMAALNADDKFEPYMDQIAVTVDETADAVDGDAETKHTVKVIVSFTDDDGNLTAGSKNVALTVEKNPVTITASVTYPSGSRFIPYGTSLADVALTGTATSGGEAVKGSFAWADDTVVPVNADNGQAIYQVLFTPEDAARYCTATTMLAVDTQIGVKIVIDAPDTIAYNGRAVDVSECKFYARDVDARKMIKGATLDVTGAVLEQTSITPGKATVSLKSFETCDIVGISDADMYAIVDTNATDIVTITRAALTFSGEMAYTADYGDTLDSIELNLKASTADEADVDGSFDWAEPTALLDEAGTFTRKVTFTPTNLNCYKSADIDVKVTIGGTPGKVTYIIDAPDAPEGAEFTVAADNGPVDTLHFAPVEGEANRWSLTIARQAFDGTERAILMRTGGSTIESGLTLTGREGDQPNAEITLKLEFIPRKLTVTTADGVSAWDITTHAQADMDAIAPGDQVTLSGALLDGYNNLRLKTDAVDLTYTSYNGTVTFTMPAHDVAVELYGVRNYQVNCLYNYKDMGVYCNIDTADDGSFAPPADPTVEGLTFMGWMDNPEKGPVDFTQKLSSNLDIYADWRVNVTVDFCGRKGQAVYLTQGTDEAVEHLIFPGDDAEYERFTFTQSIGETALDVRPAEPEDGYVFGGWYLTPDYSGEPVVLIWHTLTEGVTLYARWYQTANLAYMWNDGTEDCYVWYNDEHIGERLRNNPGELERDGYVFTGWYRTPDCQADEKIDLETYIVEGTMDLYAGWEIIDYNITYDLNGGTNALENPATYTIEDVRTSAFRFGWPTREGYDFTGWTVEGAAGQDDDLMGALLHKESTGDAKLTANWTPKKYDIIIDPLRGKDSVTNPTEYTIESDDITLNNPTAAGYTFIGWALNDSDEIVHDLVIPKGSTGNREYRDYWEPSVPIDEILQTVLGAVPSAMTTTVGKLPDSDAIQGLVDAAIQADETAALYIKNYDGDITVDVEPIGDAVSDGSDMVYRANVTVSFLDDYDNQTQRGKVVTLRAAKNPVTLEVSAVNPEGEIYLAYGSTLARVGLTGTATYGDQTVPGTFSWVDETIRPLGANNGALMYEVVFTPDDTEHYSVAQTAVAVNAQVGVKPMIDLETLPYYSDEWNELIFESYLERKLKHRVIYMVDVDTGDRLDEHLTVSTSYSMHSGTYDLTLSSRMPGPATISLNERDGRKVTVLYFSNSGEAVDWDFYYSVMRDNKYYLVSQQASKDIQIVPAQTRSEYIDKKWVIPVSVESGTRLGDIDYEALLHASPSTWYFYSVSTDMDAYWPYRDVYTFTGKLVWETPDVVLDTVGDYTFNLIFQPDLPDLYLPFTTQIPVSVTTGMVPIPEVKAVEYNGQLQKPDIDENNRFYTVVSNSGGTDAGDYTVHLRLKDPANTSWSDHTTADKYLTFTIQPRTLQLDESGFALEELGYGELLCTDPNGQSTAKAKTANDMIKGLKVIGIDGQEMRGKWVWDASMEGVTLCASAKDDDGDFGDGHLVKATFVPEVSNQANYAPLTKTFNVQVLRQVPNTYSCFARLADAAIYQPAPPASLVSSLYEFPIVLLQDPKNDVTGESVSGTVDWEEPKKKPDTSGFYNAVFYPDTQVINGVEGSNYTTALVAVDVYVSNSRYAEIESADGSFIYGSDSSHDGPTMSKIEVSIESYGPSDTRATVCLDLHNSALGPMRVSKIKLYRPGSSDVQAETVYDETVTHGSVDIASYKNIPIRLRQNEYKEGKYGLYQIVIGDTNYGYSFAHHLMNIRFEIELTPIYKTAILSLRSPMSEEALPAAPTAIPEPGDIGNDVRIEPQPKVDQSGDVWMIPLEEGQREVEFKWEASEPAAAYLVYAQKQVEEPEREPEPELIDMTEETDVRLDVSDYADGRYTLYVGAVLEDGSVTWGAAQFELIPYVASTAEPTSEPTAEPTSEPTAEPTSEPTAEPTSEPTAEPTEEPTAEPTEEPTAEPTSEPTAEPTEEPTAEPMEEPTAEPTEEPTAEPTEEPTAEPTPEPTSEPTKEPTPEPAPEAPSAEPAE